jgi:subtilisin family serine protease
METNTYLILRVIGRAPEAAAQSKEPIKRESAEAVKGGGVQIQTETLDRRDYQEARRDPQIRAIAPPIPIKLVKPFKRPPAKSAPITEKDVTWGVEVTGANKSPYTGKGVTVAVLDTGIDAGHEAFAGVQLVQKDFTGEGDGDDNGHGTHVAGTIFGRDGKGIRYSIAPGVQRALIGKVLGAEGGGSTQGIVEAIQWAVNQGAQIINMSLGMDFPGLVKEWVRRGAPVDLATSRALQDYRDNLRLFDRLVAYISATSVLGSSALLVAAAGNESKRQIKPDYELTVAPPAAADGILSVAALQTAGAPHDKLQVAPFSNIGALLAAPGVNIYSAKAGGGYMRLSGTSMASPHVAGIAALWAERQLQRSGALAIATLNSQIQANTRTDRIVKPIDILDVGAGLVSAPLE